MNREILYLYIDGVQPDWYKYTVGSVPTVYTRTEQTAAIEVNEEGTKASAVTVAGADIADLFLGEKVCFYANTPFVYMIREASSGAVFFIGTYQGE